MNLKSINGVKKNSAKDLPLIALAGRVNVGKSTLFNRCVGKKKAVTAPVAGTTRDVNQGVCTWRDQALMLADTGGFIEKAETEIEKKVYAQLKKTLKKADVILFMVDVKDGLVPDDLLFLKNLRALTKAPTIFVANKADKFSHIQGTFDKEWLKTGLGKPFAISAATGVGVGDLLDHVLAVLKKGGHGIAKEREDKPIQVSIIGRTNVGKSSLLNAILGEERVIVSAQAHTTREPQDTFLEYEGTPLTLIDTVGIRKKSKVASSLEREGVVRSIANIKKSDVVLLVFDGSVTPAKQESRLAQIAVESGAGILLVMNKWDLVAEKDAKSSAAYESYFKQYFSFISWAPMLFVSALTGQRTHKILDAVRAIEKARERRIRQEELDIFIKKAIAKLPPQWIRGKKKPVIYGISQLDAIPPTFELLVGERMSVSFAYLRYLENRLREHYDFGGTPIRIHTEKRVTRKA
ncbi:ribosome biogenesis GTPase Der [Candidatus Uhrbacteria bacterium]|nr:ribosome biogenesis GTPase Der [Candidatus Uhrbacteria bacterium]